MEEKQELKVRHKLYTFVIDSVENIPQIIVDALVLGGGYEVDDELIQPKQKFNTPYVIPKVKITVYRVEKKVR
jgi:hypothetical protein